METWKEYRIKDLGEVITGNTPPTSNREYYGSEYKFIKPTDMVEGQRFVPVTEEYYSELAYQKYKRCLLPPKTPCVVTIGSLGKKMCLTDTECFTNQAVNAVIPNKNNDGEFLYYAFKASVLAYVKQLDSGTTSGRENVSKSSFSNIKVKVPPLPTQQKIASILSAYDNLIQNYKKQIEDLQTTASELYKEWFVRFRFPGYKTTQFENGIPVGWKVEKVGDHCNVFTGKKDVNQTVEDGKYAFFSCSPDTFYSNDYIYDGKAILVAGNGSYTGRTRFFEGKFDLYQRTYAITTGKQNLIEYLYWIFKTDFETRFTGGTRGAAIPYIVMGDITKYKFLYEESLVKKFIESVIPMNKKIDTLQQQITNLTQQRDLLLPRLMSGKLEVK